MILLLLTLSGLASDTAPLREGAYAMVVEVGSRSKVPVAGTTEVTTRSLVRLDVQRQGEGWVQRQQLCAVEIESDTRAKTVLPEAFIAAVPPERYPLVVTQDGQGWRYTADPGVSHIGYDPTLTGGSVPEKKGDPGVLDFDGDGHPGATVLLEVPVLGAVRLYIAQKGWSRYEGRVGPDGSISGRVETVVTEQRTLGASVSMFAANPTIAQVPERSRFRAEPIAASQSCAVLANGWKRGFELP